MSKITRDKFTEGIANRLQDVLTVTQLAKVITACEEELSCYTIEPIRTESTIIISNEYLDEFLNAKALEGRSKKTLERYRSLTEKLLEHANVSIADIEVSHIRSYLTHKKDAGCSDRTIDGERSVLSAVFGWLYNGGYIDKNPTANIGAIKYKKEIRKPYSSIELELLREHTKTLRDRAVVETLLATGCRVSEITQLNIDDVNFDKREIKVLGKGNKERMVFLNDVAIMILKRYIESRNDNSKALFINKNSKRLESNGIRHMLTKLSKLSGVENVHPHRFRRTLATSLINRGMSIQEVAAILGHENINTTMTYVYVDEVNVKHAYEKCA